MVDAAQQVQTDAGEDNGPMTSTSVAPTVLVLDLDGVVLQTTLLKARVMCGTP